MPLFGRHRARRDDAANVTPRRRGWALFNPYPQRDRTYPDNTTTRRTFKGRSNNDATRDSDPRRSRRIGRADARANGAQRVPLVTKVKQTLGIQSRGQGQQRTGRRPVDNAGRPGGPRGGGLFRNRNTVEPQRTRGWFSGSGGRYRN